MKLRATLTVEYEPDPHHYGTANPAEMAKIDADNWQRDPMMLVCSFDEFAVTVESVE